jgi:hypothetical protein
VLLYLQHKRSYFPAIFRKTFPLKNKWNSKLKLKVKSVSGGNAAHFAATVSFRTLLPQPKIHTSFFATFQANGFTCNTICNLIIFTYLSHNRYLAT